MSGFNHRDLRVVHYFVPDKSKSRYSYNAQENNYDADFFNKSLAHLVDFFLMAFENKTFGQLLCTYSFNDFQGKMQHILKLT